MRSRINRSDQTWEPTEVQATKPRQPGMKRIKGVLLGGMLFTVMAAMPSGQAQIQTTGEPGSPSATTTISGKQLPPPDPTFGGVIKEKATDSKPWWPPPSFRPRGAQRPAHHDRRLRVRRAEHVRRRRPDSGARSHRQELGCATRSSIPRRSARRRARR